MDTHIRLRGVKQNNLKNIDVDIELGSFTVICGPSGSGKSSLAFETLYAEGQRRYIDSLSNYTKQFLNKAPKPDIEEVLNIPPAIALEQKNHVRNSRSTVGTTTEISDYLRVLFARIGKSYCPNDKSLIKIDTLQDALKQTYKEMENARGYIVFKMDNQKRALKDKALLKSLIQDGYLRYLESFEEGVRPSVLDLNAKSKLPDSDFYIVVDRLAFTKKDKGRILDSFRTAYKSSLLYNHFLGGRMMVIDTDGNHIKFSEDLACSICDFSLPPIDTNLFDFSSPVGACKSCNGFGNLLQVDEEKVIPNPKIGLGKGAIYPFTMPSMSKYKTQLNKFCKDQDIDMKTPWEKLSKKTQDLVMHGDKKFGGVHGLFKKLEEKKYKMHVRIFLARFKSPSKCPNCLGSRTSEATRCVEIDKKTFGDLHTMDLGELFEFLSKVKLSKADKEVAAEILLQTKSRLSFLLDVGLEYLSLIRETKTLSGGEYQRIKLANQLGMGLSQTLYVLDEPTIGLHPRDNHRLIKILKDLRESGNTLVVVEHDRDVIEKSSHIIEIGPQSGMYGGELVFSGGTKKFYSSKASPTVKYLKKEYKYEELKLAKVPKAKHYLELKGAKGHNLQNVDLKIPVNQFSVITGVSGSGKSSLIQGTMYPAIARELEKEFPPCLAYSGITGIDYFQDVIMIDQKAVGRSGRSNPASYLGIFDEIRKLFSSTDIAKQRGLKPGYFSLNVDGGRCPECSGDGFLVVDMQFIDDVIMRCDDCRGRRYKKDTLELTYKGKNIAEVLEMTVKQAQDYFINEKKIRRGLEYLDQVGLGYIQLGQPANTLSGGESQRLKIAKELSKSKKATSLYILDEPTTGLHFEEVSLLVGVLRKLVDSGNTVVVIEHNLDLVRKADYIVDLGPDGGKDGGEIVYQGPLAGLLKSKKSITAQFL
ncbi:MAG: excinuclease ABC subunit UvrA [Bdellovibrionales bacterium]